MTNIWILVGIVVGGLLIGTGLCAFVDLCTTTFDKVEAHNVEE